eukprot:gnl/MRDRNA2_/MRDRNA2_102728_c0_seq1.p1 gnl/MRDRNA2_/MRDRNA2_102728_c0~~gnl/MRDRNA2_/MRDRNA2_102728_c0_seq1.p1  ORF type:complete len:551 (+),score=130.42 gnl/MRDRNA2_/MRDRNA2_102728_c0_seq1:133-1653(+)
MVCETLNNLGASLARSGSMEEARSVLTLTLPLQNCEEMRLEVLTELRRRMGLPLLPEAETHAWLRHGASDFASQWWPPKPSVESSDGGSGVLKVLLLILVLGCIGVFLSMRKSTSGMLGCASDVGHAPCEKESSRRGQECSSASGQAIDVSHEQPTQCERIVENPPESECPDTKSPELVPAEVSTPVNLSLSQALGLESLSLVASNCPTWAAENLSVSGRTGVSEHKDLRHKVLTHDSDSDVKMNHDRDHDVDLNGQHEIGQGRAELEQQEIDEASKLRPRMDEDKEVAQCNKETKQVQQAGMEQESNGAASLCVQDSEVLEGVLQDSEDSCTQFPGLQPCAVKPAPCKRGTNDSLQKPAAGQRGTNEAGSFIPSFLQGQLAKIRGTADVPLVKENGSSHGEVFPTDAEYVSSGRPLANDGSTLKHEFEVPAYGPDGNHDDNDHNDDNNDDDDENEDEIIIQEVEEENQSQDCFIENADDCNGCSAISLLETLEEEREEEKEEEDD